MDNLELTSPVNDAPGGEPEVIDDGSFDGGRGVEPEPEPQATPEPAAAPPDPAGAHLAGLQENPLWPVLQHLPPGLQRQIAAGQIDPAAAVARHYGGKRWSDLVQKEGQLTQLREQNQGLMTRFEALVKHLTETLGVALPEELQPKEVQPPSEVQQLAGKVDELHQMMDEQRIEGVVSEVQSYVASDREAILQEEPEYHDAEAFVSNRLIEFNKGQAQQALELWNLTKDPAILANNFSRERLQELRQGMITPEQLVTLTALDRCFDIVAQSHQRHYQGRTSQAQDILAVARRLGWKPSREGGEPQEQPAAQSGPPPAPQPRRDPNLDRVRRQVNGKPPGPARTGAPPLDSRQVVSKVAAMPYEAFAQMLEESSDPEKTLESLLKLTAVQ